MSETTFISHLKPSLQEFLKNMKISWEERSVPNISWSTAEEITHHIQSIPVQNILEIGPANGFSTMMMSLWLPEAHITSVEFSRHAFEELRYNLKIFNTLHSEKSPSSEEQKRIFKGQTVWAGWMQDAWWKMNIASFCPLNDFGTFVSKSTKSSQNQEINMLPADFGRKVTSDIFQEYIGNFSVFFGDAREVLPYFQTGNPEAHCERPKSTLNIPKKTFEVIFIDGAFRMTRKFYDLSVPLLSPGWIIIIDDVIKYRWKMNGFYEYLDTLWVKYEVIQTDPDDGIMVIKT